MIKLKDLLTETTVRLSHMKDAVFQPGKFVQLIGKKGKVRLDKKSVHKLAKIIRTSKSTGMGFSFTAHEGKMNETWNPLDPRFKIDTFYKMNKRDPNYFKNHIKKAQNKIKKQELKFGKEKSDQIELDKFWNQNMGGEHNVLDYVKTSNIAKKKGIDLTAMYPSPPKPDPIPEVPPVEGVVNKKGNINEAKVVTLPNGIKVKIDFKGLTFIGGTKPVFLDRNEMLTFFKATQKYLR